MPAAAHIPGGGFASISFPVVVRILLEIDDALVEVRAYVFVEGSSATGLDAAGLRMPSGCGNGTGVGIPLLEAIIAEDLYPTVLFFCTASRSGRSTMRQLNRLMAGSMMARFLHDPVAFVELSLGPGTCGWRETCLG